MFKNRENIFRHQYLAYPDGVDPPTSPIQNPAWNPQVSEPLVGKAFIKTRSVYEWELCLGLCVCLVVLVLFAVLTSRVILGSQSTASQPIGSGCQVAGGRKPAARSDSLLPDSEGERERKMSDEDLRAKQACGEIKSWDRITPRPCAFRGELHVPLAGPHLIS